jgi:uncharacterized protein (TIGR03663 family)
MSPAQRSRAGYAAALVFVIAISLALRLPDLGLKPLHSDEGVNGWFTLRLYWWNVYRYQFSDYHGPFLYYVNLVFFWLMGPTDKALRMGTVLAGSFAILALVPARRWLGAVGTLVAGLLLAVGPTMVYFSRTVIHEVYLVVFTMLWVAALIRFAEKPSLKWGSLAALACILCFANKETALLTTGSLGLAAGASWLLGKAPSDPRDPDPFGGMNRAEALKAWTLSQWKTWLVGLLIFFGVMVLFFSSFFSYKHGVGGFFKAFTPWLEHGTTGRNQGKPFIYFYEVMTVSQGWALWAAMPAAVWALVRRHRVGIMLVVWAASAFLVYSLIPYKTPWCVLNIDLPVFLLCGWGAQQGWLALTNLDHSKPLRAIGAAVIALPLLALPGLYAETSEASSEGYDDGARSYVYVQTVRGIYGLMSDQLGVGAAMGGDVLGPKVLNIEAKNPARWYQITRGWDHARTTYLKKAPKPEQIEDADIVVATGKSTRKTERMMDGDDGSWHLEKYELRPGWKISAWYRQAHWDAYQQAGGRENWAWPVAETDVHRPKKPKRYRKRKDDL